MTFTLDRHLSPSTKAHTIFFQGIHKITSNMCLWSYQYFSQCSHQEVVLVQFCSQSQSIEHVERTGQEVNHRAGNHVDAFEGSRDQSQASTYGTAFSHIQMLPPLNLTSSLPVVEDGNILRKLSYRHHHSKSEDRFDRHPSTRTTDSRDVIEAIVNQYRIVPSTVSTSFRPSFHDG